MDDRRAVRVRFKVRQGMFTFFGNIIDKIKPSLLLQERVANVSTKDAEHVQAAMDGGSGGLGT